MNQIQNEENQYRMKDYQQLEKKKMLNAILAENYESHKKVTLKI